MSRALVVEKQKNLERIRGESAVLAATLAQLAGEVSTAVSAAEAARLADVISPGQASAAQAKTAKAKLEGVVEKRDAAALLLADHEKAERQLEAEISELDEEVRKAERAAAVVELTKRIEAGRVAARQWIVQTVAAEMLRGVIVSDAGLAVFQALEPEQQLHGIVHAISASASALRERVERGEVLP